MNEKVEDIKKNQKLKNIKNHLKKNKVTYCVSIGVGIVAFGAGALAFGNGVQIVDSIKITLVNWKSPHTSQTILIRQGHPGNKVRWDQTGELFASQQRAAKASGVDAGNLSRHLNGKQAHVNGNTFTNLGEATAIA